MSDDTERLIDLTIDLMAELETAENNLRDARQQIAEISKVLFLR